ncbi:hypothetical protein D9613_012385 [Agrocybe pediades]|uniref:Uncharacterized protein n=1 Tax=Agrocybe pediades TaxID=84607 RepID=A0A8H4QRJ5_9AGAR|nr:hypothetical protein D9613_012385 [Agrocybe pediades]
MSVAGAASIQVLVGYLRIDGFDVHGRLQIVPQYKLTTRIERNPAVYVIAKHCRQDARPFTLLRFTSIRPGLHQQSSCQPRVFTLSGTPDGRRNGFPTTCQDIYAPIIDTSAILNQSCGSRLSSCSCTFQAAQAIDACQACLNEAKAEEGQNAALGYVAGSADSGPPPTLPTLPIALEMHINYKQLCASAKFPVDKAGGGSASSSQQSPDESSSNLSVLRAAGAASLSGKFKNAGAYGAAVKQTGSKWWSYTPLGSLLVLVYRFA